MRKVIIAMALMTAFMVFGVGPINWFFKSFLGGTVQQSYLYPIYAGLIVLTGVVVGATEIIVSEIQELKEIINKNGST